MSRLGLALLLAVALAGCPARHPAPQVLRVGTSADYAPFSVMMDGNIDGFDIAVAQRFAADTGRRLLLVAFRWPALELDLAADHFDVAMSGVTMRPWRARVGTFTRPVAQVGMVVLATPTIATSARALNAADRRVAVNAGGYLERAAHRVFPKAQIVPVAQNLTLPDLLNAGQVDAIVTDELEAPLFRSRVSSAIVLGPLTRDRKAYLARDPALAAELDAWLRAHETDGSLAALRGRAFGPAWAMPRTDAASDLDALVALVDLRLAFMPAVADAKERRGLPTSDPAQEAAVRGRARQQAALRGVDPDRIDGLFVALIAASRAVQDGYRALPATERPPVESMDLDTEARPALAHLSDLIVARAADVSRDPHDGSAPTAAVLADALDASTPLASRLAVGEAILRLQVAE